MTQACTSTALPEGRQRQCGLVKSIQSEMRKLLSPRDWAWCLMAADSAVAGGVRKGSQAVQSNREVGLYWLTHSQFCNCVLLVFSWSLNGENSDPAPPSSFGGEKGGWDRLPDFQDNPDTVSNLKPLDRFYWGFLDETEIGSTSPEKAGTAHDSHGWELLQRLQEPHVQN